MEEKSRQRRQMEALANAHNELSNYVAVLGGALVVVRRHLDTQPNKLVLEKRIAEMHKGFAKLFRGMSDAVNSMAPIIDLADFLDRNPDVMMTAAIDAVSEIDVRDETLLDVAKERLSKQFWYLSACADGMPEVDA